MAQERSTLPSTPLSGGEVGLITLMRESIVRLNEAPAGGYGHAVASVLERLGACIGADCVRLLRIDPERDHVEVVSSWGADGCCAEGSVAQSRWSRAELRPWLAPLVAGRRVLDGGDVAQAAGMGPGAMAALDVAARRYLALPLRTGGRTSGALEVQHIHNDYTWCSATLELVQAIADLIAGARERDELAARLASEGRWRGALADMVTWALGQRLTPGLYQSLLERVAALTPEANGGSILLRDERGDFRFMAAHGFDLSQLSPVVLAAAELQHPADLRVAAQFAHPYRANAQLAEEHRVVLDAAGRAQEITATLVLPLVTGDEPLGFMYLDRIAQPGGFSDATLAMASVAAAQASLVIQRLTLDAALRERSGQLERLANVDTLTGLPNRNAFSARLGEALVRAARHGQRVGLLYLDLDGFKEVNDSLGHEEGDALLRVLARRLRAVVRANDVVARLGGDEFTVIVHDVEAASDVARVAQKIVEVLGRPVAMGHAALRVTASVGIAMYPDDARDAPDLMRRADAAMYGAKAHGRDGYRFFTRSIDDDARDRLQLTADLHDAIVGGDIDVVFQPRVRLHDGAWVGLEALARWHHPTRGDVPPSQFIPLAAETGLIDVLGEHVLERACAAVARWRHDPILGRLRVSVNASLRELRRGDLHLRIQRAIARHQIAADRLEVELTETAVMIDHERNEGHVVALRELGVRVALDDFGTAYSSLAQLKRIPLDVVKLDRSFVSGLVEADGVADEAIVRAVLSLAGVLGFDVVAEGIESEAQLERVLELGCGHGQGYHFALPMPSERLEAAAVHAPRSRADAGAAR